MPLYLIRHGESTGNAARIFQGQQDHPLTPLGEEQARTLGSWLRAYGVRPARTLASPLRRAWRTAELLAAELRAAAVEPAPELREYGGGQLEGLTEEEQEARFPGYLSRPLDERGDFGPYGGETYTDVNARLAALLNRIDLRAALAKDVLLVGHGGSLYQLLKLCCTRPVPRQMRVHLGNCSCAKLVPGWFGDVMLMHLEWLVQLELIEATLAAPPRAADDPARE